LSEAAINFYGHSPVINPSFDGVAPFADPYWDYAAGLMPVSVPGMLRHAEWFSISDDTLRSAYNRAASYFLTDIKVEGEIGGDEKKRQKEYLVDQAQVPSFLHKSAIDLLTYANSYSSVFHPIMRYVSCPGYIKDGSAPARRCGSRWRLAEFDTNPVFDFSWRAGIYGRCPRCGYSGVFHDKDRPPVDELDSSRPLILKRWNPHDIRPVYNSALETTAAFDWVIPADVRTDAKLGVNKPFLEDTPWEWIMAACGNDNVRFTKDLIYHWVEGTLAGIRTRGIGIPRAIVSYRRAIYHRILQRMNEVLAYGHVVPMRTISPANTSGRDDQGDILKVSHMGGVKANVNRMIAAWRADPSSIHFSPVPLQFQSLGADARQLIPADIINQAQEGLLNGIDMPVDFYRSNMTMQNAPAGLRLVESVWTQFVAGMNGLLKFIGGRAQFLLKWQEASYKMARVTLIDSIEKSQLRVQMAQAGLISRSTALEEVDKDFTDETRLKLDDQRTEQRLQQEFEEENDAYAFSRQLAGLQGSFPGAPGAAGGGQPAPAGGGGGGGGQPDPSQQAGPGGPQQLAGTPAGQNPLQSMIPQPGNKIDPREYMAMAQQAAKYLLTIDESQRYQMLRQIEQANPDFHVVVKAQLEKSRSKMKSQGYQMVQSQMSQGGQR